MNFSKNLDNILSVSECLRASADFFDMSINNDLNSSILELSARKVQLEGELSVINNTLSLLRSQVRTVPPKAYQ